MKTQSKSVQKRPAIQQGQQAVKPAQRYRLLSDDDGHDYLIPVGQEELFYQWMEALENYEETELDFEDARLNGVPARLSFTDPKED